MSKLDIMVGDIIELNRFMDAKGNAIRVKKLLVCLPIKRQMIPTGYSLRPIIIWICLFHQKVFESDFINLKKQSFVMTTTWSLVFDYKELAAEQIDSFVSETEDMMQETSDAYNCKIDEPAYLEVLREYQTSAKKVRTTLLILQFPVLALLLAFIFMISRQMLDLEQNEIALLKSRGSSKKQIILIYFFAVRYFVSNECCCGTADWLFPM